MSELFKTEEPQPFPKPNGSKRDPIAGIVGALVDPIIVFPAGGWENDLPENLKKRVPLDRLIHQTMCSQGTARWDECCDLEALIYMYPATMAQPLSEQWSRIYLYLGTKVMEDELPEDAREKELRPHDLEELRRLKVWIQNKKKEERLRRAKEQMKEGQRATAAVVRARPEPGQIKLF